MRALLIKWKEMHTTDWRVAVGWARVRLQSARRFEAASLGLDAVGRGRRLGAATAAAAPPHKQAVREAQVGVELRAGRGGRQQH